MVCIHIELKHVHVETSLFDRRMQNVHDAISGMSEKKLEYFLRMSPFEQGLLAMSNEQVRYVDVNQVHTKDVTQWAHGERRMEKSRIVQS